MCGQVLPNARSSSSKATCAPRLSRRAGASATACMASQVMCCGQCCAIEAAAHAKYRLHQARATGARTGGYSKARSVISSKPARRAPSAVVNEYARKLAEQVLGAIARRLTSDWKLGGFVNDRSKPGALMRNFVHMHLRSHHLLRAQHRYPPCAADSASRLRNVHRGSRPTGLNLTDRQVIAPRPAAAALSAYAPAACG